MARVLVTGATGFIGSYLVDALIERGDQVVCLTRSTSNVARLDEQSVQQVQGDLNDSDSLGAAVANVDVVYHLAGLVAALSEKTFMKVNAEGTRQVAEVCAAQPNPPVLLYLSSLAVAGTAIDGRPVCEVDPCRPVSHYGSSKRAGELAAASFADRVPVTIVRPPIVFGGRDTSTWKLFAPISRLGVHFVPGYRHRRRYSIVHSIDLVDAIILAATRGTRLDVADADSNSFRKGCYFAAFDEQLTLAELGNLIGEAFGRRFVAKIPVPDSMVKFVGGISELLCQARKKPHIFGRDKARDVTAGSWTCSSAKIRQEVGFSPAATLPDRLRETVAWFRKEGWCN